MEFESVGNMGWNGDFMLEMSTGIVEVCWKGMSGRNYRKKEGGKLSVGNIDKDYEKYVGNMEWILMWYVGKMLE